MTIKINEQIAKLRRQKGITQEELAVVLGVTNQAVSKWESGQCCPDIQLLPDIAKYFETSADELLGIKTIKPKYISDENVTRENIINIVVRAIKDASPEERIKITLDTSLAMHAAFFLKEQNALSSIDSAVKSVLNGQWGYSAYSMPDITTVMRGQSVFYSKNTALNFSNERISSISGLLKILANRKNLAIISALYKLTVHSEEAYASISEIAKESKISEETVLERINEDLFSHIEESNDNYRIKGEDMATLPIISILCY